MKRPGATLKPRDYWEERARRYGSSFGGWKAVCFLGAPEMYNRLLHKLQKRALARDLRLSRNTVCLEFGCGVGRWLCELSPQVRAIHGLDISYAMLELARNRTGADGVDNAFLSQFDGVHIPYRDASFDIAFSVTVLIHVIDSDNLSLAVEELCRVTKPGGRILILECFAPALIPAPPHVKFRKEEELVELFKESGWGLLSSRPVFPFPPGEAFLKTRASRVFFRLLSPLYYLLNVVCQKLGLAGSPPAHKIQLYRYEGKR